MDKQQKRTITIKINGVDRQIQEHSVDKEEKKDETEKEKSQITPVSSTEQNEAARIEKQSIEQLAAVQEEQFEWLLPENKQETPHSVNLKKKKAKPSPNKVLKGSKSLFENNKNRKLAISLIFIILIAVLVGTSYGLIMLKMVKSEQKSEAGVSSGVSTGGEEESGKGSLTAEPITGFIVQGGVFETKEAAERGLIAAEGKGTPATLLDMEGKTYLFLGVAENMDNAKAIGAQFAEKGIDIFVKEVIFGATTKTGLAQEEITLLKQATTLFKMLSSLSANGVSTENIPAGEKETFAGQLEKWEKVNNKNINTSEVQEIKKEMDEAIDKFRSFEEKGDKNLLVEVQQHLLNFLALYQKL